MKIFYVYKHVTNDGRTFYVGKGSGNRSHDTKHRSQVWKRIVAKHGYNVQIVVNSKDEQFIFNEEVRLIAEYNTFVGKDHAPNAWGANLTRGGEGPSGMTLSEEARAKCQEARAKQPPRIDWHPSEEHKRRIGQAAKGNKHAVLKPGQIRKPTSNETRCRQSEAATRREQQKRENGYQQSLSTRLKRSESLKRYHKQK